MFRIVSPQHRHDFAGQLRDMHEMRYRIVVEDWGWDIPGIEPGYDKDQFDTSETVYVLVLSEEGDVVASARLNPTTRPHMMSALFADYCDLQPFPIGEDVWECSRFVIDTARAANRLCAFRLRCHLGIGITSWCLDQEVRRLSWLTHQTFYNYISGLFRTEPLGLPKRQGENWAWIAAVSDIDLAALDEQIERLRRAPDIVAALTAGRAPGGKGQAA